MKDYHTIVKSLLVLPEGDAIYSDLATEIGLEDEAAGLYVYVKQDGPCDVGKILITVEEWPSMKTAVERMLETCRTMNQTATDNTTAPQNSPTVETGL
jgi:hypothetical protein